ncbi:hypothetical protein BJX65DRAFT_216483 [Aspergillus insuetus]
MLEPLPEKWPYSIRDPEIYTRDLYRNLTTTTGCAETCSPLECLRRLPIESLSAALNTSNTPVLSGTGLGPWLTQVDRDFLLDGPPESLDKAHFVPVPITYTTTTDEAAVFKFVDSVNTDADFQAFIAAGGLDNATIAEIEKFYSKRPGPTNGLDTNKRRNRNLRRALKTVYRLPD